MYIGRGADLQTQICAAAMAFLAFTVSMIIGLVVDNPFVTVIGRSIVVMFIFYALGAVLSMIGQKVIQENFEAQADTLRDGSQELDEMIDVVALTPEELAEEDARIAVEKAQGMTQVDPVDQGQVIEEGEEVAEPVT